MKLSHCHILVLVVLCLGFTNLAFGTTYYVSTSGDDVNGTGSPSNPFKTIQHGIDVSADDDVVVVQQGTYIENIGYGGKAITVRGSDLNNWETVAATIIDGSNGNEVVVFCSDEGTDSVLEGLTVTGGCGGVYCYDSASPCIRKCIIKNVDGDAIVSNYGSPIVTNNRINNNYSGVMGGSPIVKNNLIFNNEYGVGLGYYGECSNNTIVNNSGSGISGASGTHITNCIIWNNGDDLVGCNATYSCISDGDSGTGNISSYPYFANYNNNDFHLTWNSPCIDKGDPNGNYTSQVDIDGGNRTAYEHADMGADEFDKTANLVPNGGFEDGGGGWNTSGVIDSSVPKNWKDFLSSTAKTIDSSEKYSGNYSWKFYNSGTSHYSAAFSDFIPNISNNYKVSLWLKSQYGTEPPYIGFCEWNTIDYVSNTYIPGSMKYFVLASNYKIPTEWTNYKTIFATNPSSPYLRLNINAPWLAEGTVWWDDFELIEIGPNFLYLFPYGISDEPNISETVNFGEDTNIDWVTWLNQITSASTDSNDSNIKYRSLIVNGYLEIQFPAFNYDDANGLPLTPMLLEIMFKDTTQNGGSGDLLSNYVQVSSRMYYPNLDPNYNTISVFEKPLVHLGGAADNKWKYVQYAFQKSDFQLLRANNGKYTFKVYAKNMQVPIDYITLRKITDHEYSAFFNKQREARGFYQVSMPSDVPISPPEYNDLTVYVRDIMKPVYKNTKPAASEIVNDINAVSAWELVEPITFAIYSQNGIDNLTFEVSDLVNTQNPDSVILKENISVSHVIYSETRLGFYTSFSGAKVGYMLMPDYLKEFTNLSIEPNSSERIWITIKMPKASAGLFGGLYEGTITIKQNGNCLRNIDLDLNVIDTAIDKPNHMNPVYRDPTNTIFSSTSLSYVLKLCGETGLEPFIGTVGDWTTNGRIALVRDANNAIIYDSNGIAEFNSDAFEASLGRMKLQGCLAEKMHLAVATSFELADVYRASMGTNFSMTDPNLYAHLSNPTFVATFEKLIRTYKHIGEDPNWNVDFIFHVEDEPGINPYRRILCDRLYTIIHDCNCLTGVTYYAACDSNLYIVPSMYVLPPALDLNLPPLTSLVDYKIWSYYYEETGYANSRNSNYFGNFGYYTTELSHWRDPVYNRFLHGLFAFATDANVVSAYALGDYRGDPYNDFDAAAFNDFPFTYPDFLYAYPTWSGKLYPTIGGLEAIREGIKDARYIATLKRLISEHPGADANNAQDYLDNLKAKIDPNFNSGYYNKRTELGYAQEIFSHISDSNDPNDFEAFTKVRETVIDYIKKLLP